MNPPPLMSLIEIIRGMHTDEKTYRTTRALSESMGKQVSVSADRPVSVPLATCPTRLLRVTGSLFIGCL